MTSIILICLIVLVVIYILAGITIVSQSEVAIIERLGKYNRTLGPGIHVRLPIIETFKTARMRVYNSFRGAWIPTDKSRIDMREQVLDFEKQQVITKDNVLTEINALLYYQIVDAPKAVYEINDFVLAIQKLTQTTLRNVIGELELDQTLTSRDSINNKLRNVLDDATNKWGIKISRVELQDISPDESIRRAMEKQMMAERDRRATILEAEGIKQAQILKSEAEKQAQINAAEAEKQSNILRADGEAQAKIMQAEAEAKAKCLQADAEAAAFAAVAETVAGKKNTEVNYMLAVKYIEALKDITSGKDNKTIYLPYEATNVLGSIGGIKDLFNK